MIHSLSHPQGKPLIAVCGKYGSGKSTTARFIHRHLEGFDEIGIDDARQRLGLIPYRKDDNPFILAQMDLWVRESLARGDGVIVDRPHQTYESRLRSYEAAFEHGRHILLIECVCPEGIARERISSRPPSGSDQHLPSNDPGIFDRIKRNWEEVNRDFALLGSLESAAAYVRFDTHVSSVVRFNVPREMREFTEAVCGLLEP